MVMTRDDEFFEPVMTDDSTSPSTTIDSIGFFSDEEEFEQATMEGLDLSAVSLTPLVKEELKFSIQTRREADGKGPISIDFNHSEPEQQLTEEEEDRRQQRRLRNKFAAQKCRSKKKDMGDQLEKEAEKLETRQEKLQAEVELLKREREMLQEMLDIHEPFCKKRRGQCVDIISLQNDHTYTSVTINNVNNNAEGGDWLQLDID